MDPMSPAYASPLNVGDTVLVTGTICIKNSSGGTEMIRDANIVCVVTKGFWDYEAGWRFHGKVPAEADVAVLQASGLTEYGPDWYRANRPDDAAGLAKSEKALAAFDPSKVYFSEHEITLNPEAGLRR